FYVRYFKSSIGKSKSKWKLRLNILFIIPSVTDINTFVIRKLNIPKHFLILSVASSMTFPVVFPILHFIIAECRTVFEGFFDSKRKLSRWIYFPAYDIG